MQMQRVPTGIQGLDSKMQGGFFQGSSNLVTGKTGTGKTAFSACFLYDGLLKKEHVYYVTTEQREEDIKADIETMFGFDFDSFQKKKQMGFLSIKPVFTSRDIEKDKMNKLMKLYISDITNKIALGIRKIRAKRVVIDSVSIIEMFIKEEYLSRTVLVQLVENLKTLGTTSILTGTIPETSEALSGGGIIEYIVDSVLKLEFVPVAEEFKRTLTIRKMRRTDHSTLIHPFEFTKKGLKITYF